MKIKSKNLCYFTGLSFIILGFFFAFNIFSIKSKECSTTGSVRAISSAIHSELEKNNNILKKIFSPTMTPRFLTQSEYDELVKEIISYNLDCQKEYPLCDLWGNRFEIKYQDIENRDFQIISKGSDGILGTKDDIEW